MHSSSPGRVRREGGRHRRRHADRPPTRAGVRLITVQNILGEIDGIDFVRFTHNYVVRHKLVQRIVEAYKRHAEETRTKRGR